MPECPIAGLNEQTDAFCIIRSREHIDACQMLYLIAMCDKRRDVTGE